MAISWPDTFEKLVRQVMDERQCSLADAEQWIAEQNQAQSRARQGRGTDEPSRLELLWQEQDAADQEHRERIQRIRDVEDRARARMRTPGARGESEV